MEKSDTLCGPGSDLSLDRTMNYIEHFWVNWEKKNFFFLTVKWRLLTEKSRFENNMYYTISFGLKWIKNIYLPRKIDHTLKC